MIDIDSLFAEAARAMDGGNMQAARQLLARARKLAPNNPSVHLNSGEAEMAAGDLISAEGHFRNAISLDQDDADAQLALGTCLLANNSPAEAVEPLKFACRLAPEDAEARVHLANAYRRAGDPKQAIGTYQAALRMMPGYAEAQKGIAFSHMAAGDHPEADKAFVAMGKTAPLTPDVVIAWAQCLVKLRRYDDAIAKVDAIIAAAERVPSRQCARAHAIRGNALHALGRFDEAVSSCRSAIAAAPEIPEAYIALANMRELKDGDAAPLMELMANERLPVRERASAGFALARYLDRREDYDAAFTALDTANRLAALHIPFTPDALKSRFAAVRSAFDADFLSKTKKWGDKTQLPVFVCGMPRTGTTLTEQILAAHPKAAPGGERSDFQDLIAEIDDYPRGAGTLDKETVSKAADKILEGYRPEAGDALRFVDKRPGNYACLGLIATVFPGARVIHCRRDPRDVAVSCFEQDFTADARFMFDLEAFAVVYGEYLVMMAHWREVLPQSILEVDYEALVSDPEPHIRRIIDFCGLDWDDACLAPQDIVRPVDTPSSWQVRQPISAKSVGRWKRYERHLPESVLTLRNPDLPI